MAAREEKAKRAADAEAAAKVLFGIPLTTTVLRSYCLHVNHRHGQQRGRLPSPLNQRCAKGISDSELCSPVIFSSTFTETRPGRSYSDTHAGPFIPHSRAEGDPGG